MRPCYNFNALSQEGEHLLEICHQMNKGICFNINQYLRIKLHSRVASSVLVLDMITFTRKGQNQIQ